MSDAPKDEVSEAHRVTARIARSLAIDDAVKVVREIEAIYAEDGQLIVVIAIKAILSRLEALKEAK
jgi:hypothetical protein